MTPNKKSPSSRKLSKKKLALLLILTLILIGGLWYAWVAYQSHKRFARADQVKTEIVNKMVERLGDNVQGIRNHNVCFNSEQGKLDNGRLWCETATIINLKDDAEFTYLGENFMNFAREAGVEVKSSSYVTPRFWAIISGRLACSISYQGLKGDVRNRDFGELPSGIQRSERPALAISCSDRAAARHYPYVDQDSLLRNYLGQPTVQ